MKTKIYIIIAAVVITIAINLYIPFQSAIACDTWDPNYNWATGECDLPPDAPSGERAVEGDACYSYSCNGSRMHIGNDVDCEWAVAGECTPSECENLYPLWC
jgi:hypothetical protein